MSGDLLDYRPVLWLLMASAAVALLVSPWFISMFGLGAAVGLAGRTHRRQRAARAARAAAAPPPTRRARTRRR